MIEINRRKSYQFNTVTLFSYRFVGKKEPDVLRLVWGEDDAEADDEIIGDLATGI